MRATGLLLLAPVLYARAQVTLFLPGFDEQPLIADVAGTDGQGRTTYFVHNTETDPNVPADGFFGTATVVQGPTDASIHFEAGQITIDSSCTWTAQNIEQATCTAVDPAGQTAIETAALPLLSVQLGTTVGGPAPTANPGSSAAQPSSSGIVVDSTALTKPSASRPLTSGPSASGPGGSSGAAEPTGDSGSASHHVASGALLLVALALTCFA